MGIIMGVKFGEIARMLGLGLLYEMMSRIGFRCACNAELLDWVSLISCECISFQLFYDNIVNGISCF